MATISHEAVPRRPARWCLLQLRPKLARAGVLVARTVALPRRALCTCWCPQGTYVHQTQPRTHQHNARAPSAMRIDVYIPVHWCRPAFKCVYCILASCVMPARCSCDWQVTGYCTPTALLAVLYAVLQQAGGWRYSMQYSMQWTRDFQRPSGARST